MLSSDQSYFRLSVRKESTDLSMLSVSVVDLLTNCQNSQIGNAELSGANFIEPRAGKFHRDTHRIN